MHHRWCEACKTKLKKQKDNCDGGKKADNKNDDDEKNSEESLKFWRTEGK